MKPPITARSTRGETFTIARSGVYLTKNAAGEACASPCKNPIIVNYNPGKRKDAIVARVLNADGKSVTIQFSVASTDRNKVLRFLIESGFLVSEEAARSIMPILIFFRLNQLCKAKTWVVYL